LGKFAPAQTISFFDLRPHSSANIDLKKGDSTTCTNMNSIFQIEPSTVEVAMVQKRNVEFMFVHVVESPFFRSIFAQE
jgi:hypothetical protein